ncbi:MAG: HAD family phosphatase [Lachnospiraceae bacterium]|nr:HAD family phosphatase [Lachnospiraceae bacterium]
MLENIDAVIFDLDGTLVDSMWLWPTVDEEFMKKYHLVKPDRFHEDMEGMSYTETSQFFKDIFNLEQSIEEIQKEWLEMTLQKYIEEVPLKPGAFDFIIELHSRKIKLGIATSNSRELVNATLKARNIEQYFTSVRTSCEVEAGKPSPAVYLKVAEDLNVIPSKCLVFEDVPKGILAGKNAGMIVCAIDDEFTRPQEKKKKQLADYYIQSYYDIKSNTYEVL